MKGWIILAVVAFWPGLVGCRQAGTPEANADVAKVATEVLRDFELNDTKNGIKIMTLKSSESRVYESQRVADVDRPLLIFYKEGKESSRLNAPIGRVRTDTHEVECWGGVTVVSADSTTLTTERLRYDPKYQKIYSTGTVRLVKPDSVTEGAGLETDPELKTVKIGKQKVMIKKGKQL